MQLRTRRPSPLQAMVAAMLLVAQAANAQAGSPGRPSFIWDPGDRLGQQPRARAAAGLLDADPQVLVELALGLAAKQMNGAYHLLEPISLEGRACGRPNAFYEPKSKMVIVCYELGAAIRASLADGSPPSILSIHVIKALDFVVAHEVGHAMVDVVQLPVLGREEDAADQFAFWHTAEQSGNSAALTEGVVATLAVSVLKMSVGELENGNALSDNHELGLQRVSNVDCWFVGYAHSIGLTDNFVLVTGSALPDSRRNQCPQEYMKLSSSWRGLLARTVISVPGAQ